MRDQPSEEQGINLPETPEEEKQGMETGEKEEDVYSEEGRESLVEDDEIEPWEEEFMEGAEEKGEEGNCAHCGNVLSQEPEEVIEREIKGKKFKFCSDKCAQKGPKKEAD